MPSRAAANNKITRALTKKPSVSMSQLVEDARRELGLSQNAVAPYASMTGTRWRAIIRGQRGISKAVPVNARPETWALLCRAVGLTPGDVAPVDPDVAKALRNLPELVDRPERGHTLWPSTRQIARLKPSQLTSILMTLREMTDDEMWQLTDELRTEFVVDRNSLPRAARLKRSQLMNILIALRELSDVEVWDRALEAIGHVWSLED